MTDADTCVDIRCQISNDLVPVLSREAMASSSMSRSNVIFSKNSIRAIMLYNFERKLKAQECFEEIRATIGDQAPSLGSVYYWYQKFSTGHFDLEDDSRTGRPKSSTDDDSVARVQEAIDENPSHTYRSLEASLGLNAPALNSILHDHLGLTKKMARWVPRDLTAAEKQRRVDFATEFLKFFDHGRSANFDKLVTGDETWIYFYDPLSRTQSREWSAIGAAPPTKTKREKSSGKVMIAVFITRSGVIANIEVEEGSTVTAEWYTTKCLPKVFDQLQQRCPKGGLRRWFLHHDNAPAHTAMKTKNFIEARGIHLVTPAPYSPDLAPCDFFLFPTIKRNLRGKRFLTRQEALAAATAELKKLQKVDFELCFDSWLVRLRKCIAVGGNYVEVC